jgi:tetratricopeptide (TPR) repeat protein
VRGMSVETIADALDQGFALLSGGSSAALPRHRALHATLEWSHALLDDDERFAYRRLAAFAGPFTLALADRVASPDGRSVAPVLARLADKSLIVQTTGARRTTWRMLEPVRQHAAEKLATDEASAARRALVDVVTDLGVALLPRLDGDDVADASEEVAELHANVREALRVATATGDADRGITLMENLATYWISRGLWREGREIVDRLLVEGRPGRPRSVAAAHLLWGQFSMLLGESALARGRMLEALPYFRDAGDAEGLADSLNALSQVEWQMMDLPVARAHGEESLALRRRSGRRDMIANSLNNVGLIARAEGDLAGARRHLDECLAMLRELGHAHALAIALGNVGTVALDQQDHEAAELYLAESLEQARLCGSRRAELFALANLGAVAFDTGRLDECLAREREAAALCRELSDRSAGMTILWTLARVSEARGEVERAAMLLGAGLALREALGASRFHGQERWTALRDRARAALGDARFDDAFAQGRALSLEDAMGLG